MTVLETRSANSGGSCACCGERWRKFEQCICIVKNGRIVRGERYCIHCEEPARNNNPELGEDYGHDAEQAAERKREDWAGYLAAGASSEFWTDQDAGYV